METFNTETNGRTLIKKYSDRRLYDSSTRRYVNLQEIAGMIREGVEVEVRDARSGKDLTRVVLTQIIVEEARDEQTGLPVKLLRQLVMASDRAAHDFLSRYLEGVLDLYQKAGAAVRSGVSGAKSAVSSPVEYLRHLLGAEPQPAQMDDGGIEELRRHVRELDLLLAERTPRKTKRKPARKTPAKKRKGPAEPRS